MLLLGTQPRQTDDTLLVASPKTEIMSRNCSWFERGLIEPWAGGHSSAETEMERPPSQLENVRPSGLKQPSRLPALGPSGGNASRTLLETSQSDLNARSAMPPPAMGPGHKHKISGRKQGSIPFTNGLVVRSRTDPRSSARTASEA